MSLSLEKLPDDVLVMAMQYLSVDDLLACRLVCNRLGGLALHRDVWRHRRIDVDERCVCAVLQLAPCAGTIVYRSKAHCTPSVTARCAAARLDLYVGKRYFNAAECAVVVRNQELLGRLRCVSLESFDPTCQTRAALLLRTLASCSGLEKLETTFFWPKLHRSVVVIRTRALTSTLKYFECQLTEDNESFVHVLAGHAATLEEVHIASHFSSGHIASGTAGLLAAMPKLRKLSCEALHCMEAVARCASLREVDVYLAVYAEERVVESFIEQATQLRSINLYLDNLLEDRDRFCDGLMDSLSQALSAAPRPLLERLTFCPLPEVGPLIRALPRLPGLRHLEVVSYSNSTFVFEDELLLGITLATAPALRLLHLTQDDTDCCEHAWMHGDAVETVLRENPSLHILLGQPHFCKLDDCEACNRGCHKEIASTHVGLYSHHPDECPSPEDHPTDKKFLRWIQIPFNNSV